MPTIYRTGNSFTDQPTVDKKEAIQHLAKQVEVGSKLKDIDPAESIGPSQAIARRRAVPEGGDAETPTGCATGLYTSTDGIFSIYISPFT